VPTILTVIISFLYRYLFVLADEVMRLLRAREARSAVVAGSNSGGSVLWRARVTGNMAGQLFLRSYERSDRVYNAMLSRGYKGELMTMHSHEYRASDWQIGSIVFIGILIAQIVGRLP
jgi:cobalt/nickel transport system permease protein